MGRRYRHRLIVADDHPLFRDALAGLLARTADFEVVATSHSFESTIAALEDVQCDLVALDLRMPGMNGLEGVQIIRCRWPETKIALVSGNLDPHIVSEALAAGVTGFSPKSLDGDVIVAALRLVLAGGIYVPHDLVETPHPRPGPLATGAPDRLTSRELEVLQRLVQGLTYKEIARDFDVAEVTIKLHAQRIVRKLGVKNRSAAIAKAVESGLVSSGERRG